jgi:hypothetical protein
VGGLAHYFEEEGIPTTQISLIREHTERIKPPRALWVPFELGRPFGVPNDADFQRRVLVSALRLLEAPRGPIIEDFGEDAPAAPPQDAPLFCPISIARPSEELSEAERLKAAFSEEFASMRSWYDLAVKKRGRTTVGNSGLDLDTLVDFIFSFAEGALPPNPKADLSLPDVLKLAVDDLKAYYFEAVTAQPGNESLPTLQLVDWFWQETTAGAVLKMVKNTCKASDDGIMKVVGMVLLVPTSQRRFAKRT